MSILHSSVSDHKLISLELLTPKDLGPIPFRFSSLWTKEADFMQKVRDCWKDPVKGSPFFVWEEKLRRVKAMLKDWVKTLPNPIVERKKSKVLQRSSTSIQKLLKSPKKSWTRSLSYCINSIRPAWKKKNSGGSSPGVYGSKQVIEIPLFSISKLKPGNAVILSLK